MIVVLWLVTAWLLYPLVILDSVDFSNAKQYFYRSVIGITIMLILFGKTFYDLFFPFEASKKISLVNTVFLTVYCIAIAGGIVFMISRMVVLYLKSKDSGLPFVP